MSRAVRGTKAERGGSGGAGAGAERGTEAERGSAAVLGPAVLGPALLGWVACGGGHSISTCPAGNAVCPPPGASGADEAFRCGAAELVVADDSVGVTAGGSRGPLEPKMRCSSRWKSCVSRSRDVWMCSNRRKAWRASSCAKWPAPNVTTRATIARLTGAESAQTVRTAIKSHSKSPASDAVCQNSMPCEALTSVKRIESNGKK